MNSLELVCDELIEAGRILLSDIAPSEWCERNRVMGSDESPFPGPFSYDRSPYCREIIDCLSPNHPAKIISIMKGAQIGFSTGVIEPGIGYIISENPANIMFLTGHSDLSEEAMAKIDRMIDNSGLRKLIRPSVLRKKNMRTGDTNKSKEFPGGSLVSGSVTNHNMLRQRSVPFIFADDIDAAKKLGKDTGSTIKLIEQRAAAYYSKMKIFYISTPQTKMDSNIEPLFIQGDQRRYYIPCPCCKNYIALYWSVDIKGSDGKEKAGITWKLDDTGNLINDSVGYICQNCSGFFNETGKTEMLINGMWKPTATARQPYYYSYHISSLYAPHGMYDWNHYVLQYLEANPPGAIAIDYLNKTFVNLCLGETWEEAAESPKANQLQNNCRPYDIGAIPEKLSIADGNGKIVLLTCACDLNGKEDDARLDYEVLAWSESGSTYSITHGSIGTFIPLEGTNKADREHWTYRAHTEKSVWPELNKVLGTSFTTDTGRKMNIFISGVDCGHYTDYAYAFLDSTNYNVVGLRGDKEGKYMALGANVPIFRAGRERQRYYLLEVNKIKDMLAQQMKYHFNAGSGEAQQPGFMNYPFPSGGKYLFANYFSHYEAEEKKPKKGKDGTVEAFLWAKKGMQQNHMWDVRVYNIALRDIMLDMLGKSSRPVVKIDWEMFTVMVTSGR
jgi:phage terminase large subunit GpA-like protein